MLSAQVSEVVSEVEDAFDYYQSAFKKIKDGLHYINECYETDNINEIQSYASNAEDEISAASNQATNAEDSADDAEDEAADINCSEAEDEADDAKDYFSNAVNYLNNAKSELSNAASEDDSDYLADYISAAKDYLNQAVNELNSGAEELNHVIEELNDCKVNTQNYATSEVSCDELTTFITEEGYYEGKVSSYILDSSWLQKVTAYSYDGEIFVIAEIKDNEYSIYTNTYIFCNIPSFNWSSFKIGGYDDSTYGELFHEYIYNHKCDCN